LDLLGLSTPPSQQQNNNQNALIDVLGDIYNSSSAVNNAKKWENRISPLNFPSNLSTFLRFLFKNNGVLFENEMIQIGVKSEFRQNLGRLGLFYGNKTQVPLVNFQPVLQWTGEDSTKLNVQIKPVDSTLDAGAQIQQMITAECIDSYSGELSCGLRLTRRLTEFLHRFTISRPFLPLQRSATELHHQATVDGQQVLRADRDERWIVLRSMEESRRVNTPSTRSNSH
jgi:hypothetical protein